MAWLLHHPFDEAFACERSQCGYLFRIGVASEAAFQQQFSGTTAKRIAFVIGVEIFEPCAALQFVGLWIALAGGATEQLGHCGDLCRRAARGLDRAVECFGNAVQPLATAPSPQRET